MKIRYILFTVAALMISACAKNNEPSEPEGMQMTFTAYQEGSEMTRTAVQDGGTQVYWEPADEIKVFFNGSSGRFVSQNTENATVATFTGTINVVAGANEGGNTNYTTWGLYPYRSDASSDGSSVTTTLPAEQTGRVGSFAKNTNITLAQSSGLNLAFYNVCGGLRFSLTQEGIKRVTFEGNNGEAIAGKIKIAFANGIPVVQEVSEGESVITLTAPNGGSFQTGQWYYISAIPGSLPGGYKMVFYKESESAKLTSSSSVTFKRGVFGSLADADEDLMFKPSGSGDDPNPNDAIQFADPIAKYACVEKFDTNKDGEVSYAEAAVVTSLSGLFSDWNTVTSFDEIQYFTGVTSTENVFAGCSNLTHIKIPDNITILGSFQDCTALETVVLPATLTWFPAHCFDGCSALKNVTLPTTISYIPNYCFKNCSALTTLDIPSTVTSLGTYAFFGCTSISHISLRDGVSVGERAFSGCTALSSVVLPNDMTAIPNYCFSDCVSLKTISWPQALTSISRNAFSGCRFKDADYALELPPTVTSIGTGAFGALRHLIIPSASPVSISSDSFASTYTYLYVPANMVEMYKLRTNWNNYTDRIRPIGDYPVENFTVGGTVGQAIDLGLSVKWASWNVGASAPEEYGAYFAWGETEPKWDYDWESYKWCNGSETTLTKYNSDSSNGTVDNKTALDPEDDAAHVYWGGTWRMPTKTEFQELIDNCILGWTTENGVFGRCFTSKKEGYTDKSIFIPTASSRRGPSLYTEYEGRYWSSTPGPYYGWILEFLYTYNVGVYCEYRCYGQSIRPVCDK